MNSNVNVTKINNFFPNIFISINIFYHHLLKNKQLCMKYCKIIAEACCRKFITSYWLWIYTNLQYILNGWNFQCLTKISMMMTNTSLKANRIKGANHDNINLHNSCTNRTRNVSVIWSTFQLHDIIKCKQFVEISTEITDCKQCCVQYKYQRQHAKCVMTVWIIIGLRDYGLWIPNKTGLFHWVRQKKTFMFHGQVYL